MRSTFGTFIAGILLVTTAACATAPPRQGVVYVREGPPRAMVEVIVRSPGPEYVWQPGYYRWEGVRYVWMPGVWVVPARGYRKWAPGHWEHDRHHGWFFIEGHWR